MAPILILALGLALMSVGVGVRGQLEDLDLDLSQAEEFSDITFEGDLTFTDGEILDLMDVQKQPIVPIALDGPDADDNCTLLMVDPDAPNKNKHTFRYWLHWLVVDIPCNGDLEEGNTITPFNPSGPPKGSGLHRYFFLLFKQSTELGDIQGPDFRGKFMVNEFADQNGLGVPVKATFYRTQRV